jgi:hypothetical protein
VAYLEPPPAPAPVVVVKDVGGFVDKYRDQTERYRREDREVRLHECRSACTLALSLPNVCVYPDSILKFHKAYNVNTNQADEGVSAELFNAYPPAVRARLGNLTRQYRVLRGAELIELGIRDCNQKRTIMVAKNTPPAERQSGIAQAMGSLVTAFLSPNDNASQQQPVLTPVKVVAVRPAGPAVPTVLPPPRPDLEAEVEIPLPPRRPVQTVQVARVNLPLELHPPDLMKGAIPPIPGKFLSFAPLDALRVPMIDRALR